MNLELELESVKNFDLREPNYFRCTLSGYFSELRHFAGLQIAALFEYQKIMGSPEQLQVMIDQFITQLGQKMEKSLAVFELSNGFIANVQAEGKQETNDESKSAKSIQLLAEAYERGVHSIFCHEPEQGDILHELKECIDRCSQGFLNTEVCLQLQYLELVLGGCADMLFGGNHLHQVNLDLSPIKGVISKIKSTIRKSVQECFSLMEKESLAEGMEEAEELIEEVSAEAQVEVVETVLIAQQNSEDVNSDEDNPLNLNQLTIDDAMIQASRHEEEIEFKFEESSFHIEASAGNGEDENFSPFSGVLFPIERVSNSAPSRGSDLPLCVSMSAAQGLIQQVNGRKPRPLDVHPDFLGHNNEKIVGIMNESRVQNNGSYDELVVAGGLYPFNNPDLVQKIKDKQGTLGMSINAIASGVNKIIDGVKVFYIEKLTPLGANILEASRATWTDTAVLQAEKKENNTMVDFENDSYDQDDSNSEITIQSSSINQQEESMDEQAIQQLFNNLSTKLDGISSKLEQDVAQITTKQSSLETQLQAQAKEQQDFKSEQMTQFTEAMNQLKVLVEERNTLQAAAKKREDEEKEAAYHKNLVDTVSNSVAAQIMSALNPTGQPQRLTETQPVVQAGASNVNDQPSLSARQARLIAAEASLKTLESQGGLGDPSAKLALVEEIHYLKTYANDAIVSTY